MPPIHDNVSSNLQSVVRLAKEILTHLTSEIEEIKNNKILLEEEKEKKKNIAEKKKLAKALKKMKEKEEKEKKRKRKKRKKEAVEEEVEEEVEEGEEEEEGEKVEQNDMSNSESFVIQDESESEEDVVEEVMENGSEEEQEEQEELEENEEIDSSEVDFPSDEEAEHISSAFSPSSSSSPVFKVKDVVEITSKMDPGFNRSHGCCVITHVHPDSNTYDVKYLVGTKKAKNVAASDLTKYVEMEGSRGRKRKKIYEK